jgi:hypothetical protein
LAQLAFALFGDATLLPLTVALSREGAEPPFDLLMSGDLRCQATAQLGNQLGSRLLLNPVSKFGVHARHEPSRDDGFTKHLVQARDRRVARDYGVP